MCSAFAYMFQALLTGFHHREKDCSTSAEILCNTNVVMLGAILLGCEYEMRGLVNSTSLGIWGGGQEHYEGGNKYGGQEKMTFSKRFL